MASTPSVSASTDERRRANRRLGVRLACVAILAGGFGFAMAPLYDVFCRVTGLNGRTNTVAADVTTYEVDEGRTINVELLSHTMPGVDVELASEQFSVKVHPGAIVRVNYVAHNKGTETFVGQAVPSITPATATRHFRKIECFCFTPQTFAPGERRILPVLFVISPEIDPDLRTVTLSYTFFETPQRTT
ncbi:MAG TPA: cytochrome c oxidase assembly protein [Steroidobacteraceae bacterium]